MKRHNNNNFKKRRNPKGKKNAPSLQLGRNVNLMRSAGTALNLIFPAVIFFRQASSNYSFATSSDLRFLSFASILTNSAPFSQFTNVYSEYKIVSSALVITPYTGVQTAGSFNFLYVSCDPQGVATNPTNSTVIANQTSHLFTPVATGIRSVSFTFPGIGSSMNIWLDTSQTPTGCFYIGNNTMSNTNNTNMFDCSFSIRVLFRTTKPA